MRRAPCLLKRRDLLGACAALISTAIARAQPRPNGEVLIGGTGAGQRPLQRVLEGRLRAQFVPSLGTGGGLKAVAAGAIDIALAARPLNDEERAKGLVARELFRTPSVWAVHDGVPLRSVTLAALAALYGARTKSWADGTPVRLVLRPESDSDTRFVKSLSPALAEALAQAQTRPGVHLATTDGDAVEALERITGAVGVTTLGLVLAERRKLHVLTLDDVLPSVQTLADGRYAHAKTVWIVTRAAAPAAVAEVQQWCSSRAAAQGLLALGCIAAAAA